MPVAAARKVLLSPEEYFDWEERQDVRHEYAYGEVFPMPGGTFEHFQLIGNWIVALRDAIAASGVDAVALPDGMRVQIHDRRYVYPDVSVVVGAPAFREGSGRRVLLNPSVVVEVLSESTAAYDRGEKFAHYREVRSLREIVWVDSERRAAEVAVRTGDVWTLPVPVTDGAVSLPSLGLAVDLDAVYRGVEVG